jgi:hypothetical protein
MSALHCTTCKFTLNCSAEEAAAYKNEMPMHCGALMILAGEANVPKPSASAPAPAAKKKKKA